MFALVKWTVVQMNRQTSCICTRFVTFLALGILCGLFISSKLRKCTPATFSVEDATPASVSFRLEPESVSSTIYEIDWTGLRELQNRVRLLCYVNTIPKTYETRARAVENTWVRHCTKHLFISSEDSTELPVVNLNLSYPESRSHLWSKMQKALHYLYQFRDEFDFFYKADDDTFAAIGNLRYALNGLNPDEALISGFPFTHIIDRGHLSGGAGYVLSRGTLKLLVEEALGKHPECPTYDQDLEDVKL